MAGGSQGCCEYPAAWQEVQDILGRLDNAARFAAVTEDEDDDGPVTHTGIVPVITQRTEGDISGLYAEVMIFEEGGLISNASYRLSKLPGEATWIIDTHYDATGARRCHQPFGSTWIGRNLTLHRPFVTELDRIAHEHVDGR